MKITGFTKLKKNYIDKNKRMIASIIAKYKESISKVLEDQQKNYNAQDVAKELEGYDLEIASVINDFNRKSTEETMMVKTYRRSNQETTNRKTHQENVANVATRIAKGINKKIKTNKINLGLLNIMAQNHDIGHTFSGHSGEYWLSDIKEDYGIGYYSHNALGPRELIYTNNIYDKIIDQIRFKEPDIGEEKIKKIRSSLWVIMDGINSHNGEKAESEYVPDTSKTEKSFELENLYCHTKKGYDKLIVPATIEAALMRLSDKISSIPYDMVDGIREGIINGLDDDYKSVLERMGITKEDIEQAEKEQNYVSIARKVQAHLVKDVIENSSNSVIKMSPEYTKNMHLLRKLNYEKITNYVLLEEDNRIFTSSLREFMLEYKDTIINEGIIEKLKHGEMDAKDRNDLREKYKDKPCNNFINYIVNTNEQDFKYTTRIIKEATKQSIEDEQKRAREIIRNNETFAISDEFSMRDKRIGAYINYYQKKYIERYTQDQIEEDRNVVYNNILNKDKTSPLYFNIDERIALEMGAKYLATLNDTEYINLLRESNKINDEEFKSLTKKYKDISNLNEKVYIQSNFKEIKKEQDSIDM